MENLLLLVWHQLVKPVHGKPNPRYIYSYYNNSHFYSVYINFCFFLILLGQKGYQFWTKADRKGKFIIENVRAGNYSLYAWGFGFIGDYKYEQNITITPGIYIRIIFHYNPILIIARESMLGLTVHYISKVFGYK